MKLKYIIDDLDGFAIFVDYVQHDMVAKPFLSHTGPIVGAGFIEIMDGEVFCYGESVSLRVKSRGVVDAAIIAHKLDLKVSD